LGKWWGVGVDGIIAMHQIKPEKVLDIEPTSLGYLESLERFSMKK
jgi:hypothetical protein